jgi:hypothetical protein
MALWRLVLVTTGGLWCKGFLRQNLGDSSGPSGGDLCGCGNPFRDIVVTAMVTFPAPGLRVSFFSSFCIGSAM